MRSLRRYSWQAGQARHAYLHAYRNCRTAGLSPLAAAYRAVRYLLTGYTGRYRTRVKPHDAH